MAYNGSGTFARTNGTNSGSTTWTLDRDAGTYIRADLHDAHDQDIANGLTNCITKDGQTQPTADLPMNSKKHTAVANATARSNYASAGQVQDSSLIWAGTSTGTSTAYVISTTPAISGYVTGMRIMWKCHVDSGATPTVNINSLGAQSLYLTQANVQVGAGDLTANQIINMVYDGTRFIILDTSRKWVITAGGYLKTSGYFATQYNSGNCSDYVGGANNTFGDGFDRLFLSNNRDFVAGTCSNAAFCSAAIGIYTQTTTSGVEFFTSTAANVAPTKRWIIDADGTIFPGANATYNIGNSGARVLGIYGSILNCSQSSGVGSALVSSHTSGTVLDMQATDASRTGTILGMVATRANSSLWYFQQLYSNNYSDQEFYLRGDGTAAADGLWNGGGADYAEMWEAKEDLKVGQSVVVEGCYVREANDSDDSNSIFGVVRSRKAKTKFTPGMIVGNPLNWPGKYERDEEGCIVSKDDTPQVSEKYDKKKEPYIQRLDRPEWHPIGIMGKVHVLNGQPVNPRWVKIENQDEFDLFHVR